MNLPSFQDWVIPAWLISSISACLMACIVHLVLSHFYKKATAKVKGSTHIWKDALLRGSQRPVLFLVWFACLGWIVKIVKTVMESPLLDELIDFNRVALIALITWAVIRTIRQAEINLLDPRRERDKKLDPTTVTAVGRLLRISTMVMAVLIVMQLLGFSISGMLAFGGAGGLIVGYGAKDMLANLFGGLIIYLDKPFGVGDWIRSPDQEIEGTVEYIGWRQTRIRTFDKRPLYVPNATFSNISVENPSRMENRRIKETIGLRYEDNLKMEAILTDIRHYLSHHDEIAQDKIIMVNFNAFGPSSLDFFIYCFTKTTDWATYHMVKENVLVHILGIIHKHGADIAFPTQTVDLPDSLQPMLLKSKTIAEKLSVST